MKKLVSFAHSLYSVSDGHKMVLVEGIPTVFSWDSIQQFDGIFKGALLKKRTSFIPTF